MILDGVSFFGPFARIQRIHRHARVMVLPTISRVASPVSIPREVAAR
jgi:hypothetical protein